MISPVDERPARMDRSAPVTRSGYGVWPQGQALGANVASVLTPLGLKWTEQCLLRNGTGHCSCRWTRLNLWHPVCLWQFYAYLCDLQTGALRPDGRPHPLLTGGGTRMLALGHQPISAGHDLPDLLCRLYLFPRAQVSFLTSLHGWLTSFSSLSDPIALITSVSS